MSNKKKIKYKRSHSINILEYSSKYLLLLVFPLIRALFYSQDGLYAWFKGAWFDLLTVFIIIFLGFIAWFKYGYFLGEKGIYIKKGIFLLRYRYIPYKKLSVASIEKLFYLIPFRAAKISFDTDGGDRKTSDFAATINKKDIDFFTDKMIKPFIRQNEIKKVYIPKRYYIAVLSFISSNSITGLIFLSTFFTMSGKMLGNDFQNNVTTQISGFVQILEIGLPPLASTIAFLAISGFVISFFTNLIRHLKFSSTRWFFMLWIKTGVFSVREYLVSVPRVNLIEIRQSVLTKLCGFYSVFIHSNGYGKRKDELSVLFPSCGKNEMLQNLQLILPEIPLVKKSLSPKIKYLSRFLIPPITWILLTALIWVVGIFLFPNIQETIFYMGIMAELPCIWFLIAKIISFLHTGIGVSNENYTLQFTYGFRIKTILLPKSRVISVTIKRSLFQVMSGCCDIVFFSYCEGRKRSVVTNLNYDEVINMLKIDYNN